MLALRRSVTFICSQSNVRLMSEMMLLALVLAVVVAMLAKHGKPNRRRATMAGYVKGNIDLNFNLGALAGADVLTQQVADAVEEKMIVTSIQCSYALSNYTPTADAGPLIIGVAHSDYTDAEIEEWIELTTGWASGDLVSREISQRKIRRIGTFESPESATLFVRLFDGAQRKLKLNWILTTAQNIKFWVYNTGSAALATTTLDVSVAGHANLFPR